MENSSFDIAVLGGGCSGFQLLHHLSLQSDWQDKNVALFNNDLSQQRSWCFWSKEEHPLQHLVRKSWTNISFKGKDFSRSENVAPYQYHYIPGEAFFDYFQNQFLSENKNITPLNHTVTSVQKKDAVYRIQNNVAHWDAENVFSSLPPKLQKGGPSVLETPKVLFLLKQHFKGWFIKTEQPVFDDTTVMLMDFSIPQHDDTRFIYVLPFSKTEALVEMTVFSPYIYEDDVYDAVLHDYMNQHFPNTHFSIENTEKGAIPMTDAPFSRFGEAGEVLLGTAAGMVKATTGYAFKRIGRDSERLAEDLTAQKELRWSATKGRFRFYDRLLLGILTEEPLLGSVIFETLFKRVDMKTIMRFLDEETSLWEEIRIFSKLPYIPFLKQVYRQKFIKYKETKETKALNIA
jgi:lycopene beta-cyclase